mmetsp:Transcript_10579/g.26909  ORF Transcript_10579/g.26909 Transcript_10579/m.26909 type:complete len:479 (-) Transcript_10579:1-1437(-)
MPPEPSWPSGDKEGMSISMEPIHEGADGPQALGEAPLPEEIAVPSNNDGQSSFYGVVFNVANAALGSGVLLFPQLLARNGWVVGVLAMFTAAAIMGATLHILSVAAIEMGQRTYQNALAAATHRSLGKAIDVTMSLYLVGSCSSYFVVVADQLQAVGGDAISGRPWRVGIISAAALLQIPLVLQRDLSALALTSAFGVFTNLYVALDIAVESLFVVLANGIHPDITKVTWDGYALASAFGTFAFAFQCHHFFIPVAFTLRRRSLKRLDGVVAVAYTLCCVAYLGCGLAAYMAYGPEVHSDVLAKDVPSNFGSSAARVCLALKSMVAYPLLHFPARLCLSDLLCTGDILRPQRWRWFYGLTGVFLLATWTVALVVPDLGYLVGLTASGLGVFQVFIWPGAMLAGLRGCSRSRATRWGARVSAGILALIGGMVAVVGLTDQLRRHAPQPGPRLFSQQVSGTMQAWGQTIPSAPVDVFQDR